MDESYLLANLLPVPLWGCAVSVAAPRGDKSGVVSVFRMKEYTVVTIPCFEDGFLLPLRDRSCLVERRLGVVSFSGGMNVERLEVDCPSGCAILLAHWVCHTFGADDLSMAPYDWFSNWYGFKYSQFHDSV